MDLIVNTDALRPPLSGIGYYTRELLRHVLEDSRVDSVIPANSLGWQSAGHLQSLLGDKQEAAAPERPAMGLLRAVARKIPYSRDLRRLLQHRVAHRNRAPADALYWEPNYIPLPLQQAVFPTVHDLSHLVCPETHPSERVSYLQRHLPAAIEAAAGVITVSEFSRQAILEFFDLAPDSVSVVSPAADAAFVPQSPEAISAARVRYGIRGDFVMSLCTLEPRKNIRRLIDAYLSLPDAVRSGLSLVLVGDRGWLFEELDQRLRKAVDNAQILTLGYVPRSDLPALISAASCLAYPSLYEGFGMPVLEAMACGTAVLTSAASSMEEVCAGHAILVDPQDTAAIAAGLQRVLDDPGLRTGLESAGLRRAQDYSWQSSANRLLSLMQDYKRSSS